MDSMCISHSQVTVPIKAATDSLFHSLHPYPSHSRTEFR